MHFPSFHSFVGSFLHESSNDNNWGVGRGVPDRARLAQLVPFAIVTVDKLLFFLGEILKPNPSSKSKLNPATQVAEVAEFLPCVVHENFVESIDCEFLVKGIFFT